jgi:hypothetical protein
VSTQSPYLKAIIIFPLVTQLIGSVIAYVLFDLDDYREGYFDSALFGFLLTFWPLTVPAIMPNAEAIYAITGRGFSFFHLSLFFVIGVSVMS